MRCRLCRLHSPTPFSTTCNYLSSVISSEYNVLLKFSFNILQILNVNHLQGSEFKETEWEQEGLFQPKPNYADGKCFLCGRFVGLSVDLRAFPHSDYSLWDLFSVVPNSTPPRCVNSQLLATCGCYGFDCNPALASDSPSLISFFRCPPEIVQFTIVICVPRDWLITSYCRSSNLCHQYCFIAFVGVYYCLSCEPTLGENQIFHSVVKRQVMKTRDTIKLIGDGKDTS